MPLTDAQDELADDLTWFHSLDFGDYQTVGRISPPDPPNMTLFGVMDMLKHVDLEGVSCLDIGPGHGLVSFGMALKGAEVTAINIGERKPLQISLAEEVFGVEIDYRCPVSLAEAPDVFEKASFDLIVCAGVMYHLLNPADVFFRLRPLLKTMVYSSSRRSMRPASKSRCLFLTARPVPFRNLRRTFYQAQRRWWVSPSSPALTSRQPA